MTKWALDPDDISVSWRGLTIGGDPEVRLREFELTVTHGQQGYQLQKQPLAITTQESRAPRLEDNWKRMRRQNWKSLSRNIFGFLADDCFRPEAALENGIRGKGL